MRVVFLGTPEFAVPALHALCATHEVVAVVTQPDKPQGRGKKLQAPPVKLAAQSYDIPVYQFEKLNSPEAKAVFEALNPHVVVVVAYGQLLKSWLLDLPPYGCINVHASLLPRWRGAAPIHWSIVKGDQKTGITIMKMDVGLDTGPMLLKKEVEIGPETTYKELHDLLKMEGGLALIEALDLLEQGLITPVLQNDGDSCYASMISRDMARIDWHQSAAEIVNLIRGFDDWPAAFTVLAGERIKCFKASELVSSETGEPGSVVRADANGILVAAGDGQYVCIQEVQAPGGKRMPVKSFLLGRPIEQGTRFDD